MDRRYDLRAPAQRTDALLRMFEPLEASEMALMPNFGQDAPPRLLVATGHYQETTVLPRGVAIGLSGPTVIAGPQYVDGKLKSAGNAHLVANDRLGMATTAYAIEADDLAARFERARPDLPQLSSNSPLHRITVTQGAIFVRANDAPAAVTLAESLETPQTVQEIAESSKYRALLESSQKYRDVLARQTADALGVTIASQIGTSTSHALVRSGAAVRVLHDVHDEPSVFIDTGAGYTHLTLPTAQPFPTTTGKHDARVHTTPPNTHRPHFYGEVPVERPPLALASIDDPFVQTLIPAGAQRKDYPLVGAVAHNASTLNYPPAADLIALAAATSAKAIPVPVDHPLVAQIVANWDRIKSDLHPSFTLTSALGSEYAVPVDPLISQESVHTVATGAPFRGHRRWRGRRGFGTVLALDTALLGALALSPLVYGSPYPYAPPYYY